jgi:translation initiation factor 4A
MDAHLTLESNQKEVVYNFDEMGLKAELLRGIYVFGFEKPSAIQQRTILPCINGHDVIVQAQSGTGKTTSVLISILQNIDTSLNECQALILVPSHKLAQQIEKVILIFINKC